MQIAGRLRMALRRRPSPVPFHLLIVWKTYFPTHLFLPRFLLEIHPIGSALIDAQAISHRLTKVLPKLRRIYLFFFLAVSFSSLVYSAPADWPAESHGENLAQSLAVYNAGFEASGIAYHHELGFLIVGDDGDVANVSAVGVVGEYQFLGGDFEGITIKNGTADFAYIASENTSAIIEISLPSLSMTGKSWPLQLAKNGGLGFEGITFVPQSEAPVAWGQATYDGFFVAASQADTELRIFDIDTRESSVSSVVPLASIETGASDLSGLHFSVNTRRLYALHDSANTLTEINLNGVALAVYTTPESGAEEGVVLVEPPNSEQTYIVLTDDAGPIATRYHHFESIYAEETPGSELSAAVLWLLIRASQPPAD